MTGEADAVGREGAGPEGTGRDRGPLVVKLGGSLSREGRSADALAEVVGGAGGRRVLALSGGGGEADEVRDAVRRGESEVPEAYWEAVRALDRMSAALVAEYEATREPGRVQLCADLSSVREAWEEDRLPVLTPYPVVREVPDFPVHWQMTSDSIAAWMAYRVDAGDLVLAKARPPRSSAPAGDDGVPAASASSLVEESLVDEFLPRFLDRAEFPATCWIVNGSRAGRLASWLRGDRTAGVRVSPSDRPAS